MLSCQCLSIRLLNIRISSSIDRDSARGNHWAVFGKLRLSTTGERDLNLYPECDCLVARRVFRKLLPAVDLHKTLLAYTSDHGQSLLLGRFPHCSTTPTVPPRRRRCAIIICHQLGADCRATSRARGDAWLWSVQSFRSFSTMLLVLGYDAGWVKETYSPSLMDSPSLTKSS
jgi:hypothetical protein